MGGPLSRLAASILRWPGSSKSIAVRSPEIAFDTAKEALGDLAKRKLLKASRNSWDAAVLRYHWPTETFLILCYLDTNIRSTATR